MVTVINVLFLLAFTAASTYAITRYYYEKR